MTDADKTFSKRTSGAGPGDGVAGGPPSFHPPLGVRWTIGNVHPLGFDALRMSIWGVWKLFGPAAEYVICVNSMSLGEAQDLAGPLPNHRQELGSCGAHFVGLNAWELPWQWQGRPATAWTREFWLGKADEIADRVNLPEAAPVNSSRE